MVFGLILIYLMVGAFITKKVSENFRSYGMDFKRSLRIAIIPVYVLGWPLIVYIMILFFIASKETKDVLSEAYDDTIGVFVEEIDETDE